MSPSARNTVRDFTFGRCVIQASARQLLVDGQPARLGARAFDVLMALVHRHDAVVSKNELLDTVWPGLVVEENNLQVHVSTLRKLLGPQTIVTIPGRGYRFFSPLLDAEATPPIGDRAAPAQPTMIGNLPAQLPPLFGRDAELASLAALLRSNQLHRLITITGAGGMGKTRLAQTAAVAAQQDKTSYPDGVWWVELAPVNERQRVLHSIARTLGIALDADASAEALAARIADRHMLVVLDNCEHVIEHVAAIVETLLRAAPKLTLIATSQEAMKLAGEQVLRLGTLTLPVNDSLHSPASTAEADPGYGALVMFEARAREALPQFALNDSNREAVVEICRRLDGIPLAIEFAAARLPLLGLEGLRARLDDRFRLLTGGSRLAPKRQQTLRAALEWSHSLLSPDEQKVFRRLGVFSGSFGLDAAQQVAAGGDFDPWAALDHLGALVDKSLVMLVPRAIGESDDAPRYRLLESARAFALEHLRATEEFAATARRHADAVLKQFDAAYALLWTHDSMALLAAALPDLDNLRAALTWAAGEAGDSVQLAALVSASGWLWKPADLTAEGRHWFDVAFSRISTDMPPAIEARFLLGYASHVTQAAAKKEVPALQRAASLYRTIADRRGLYETLVTLAQKQVWLHDFDGVAQSLKEADAIFDATWPPTMREGQLAARTYLCEVRGQPAEGQPFMDELVALMRASGDARKLDFALMQLAENLFIQGKAAEAIAARREIAERIGGRRVNYAGTNLGNLCAALVFNDELGEALQVAREAIAPLQREGALRPYVDHIALLAFKLGWHAAAAHLLGRANANFAASGFEREESELRAARMTSEGLSVVLAPHELERLLIEGAAMTDEAAIRVALGVDRRVGERT